MESYYNISVKDGIHLCDQAAKVQYEQFGKLLKAGIILLGALLLYAGLYWMNKSLYKGILIVLGVWALISYNYPFVIMSERRARKTDYKFFKIDYSFGSETVLINQSERNHILEVPYPEIIRLLEDNYCFYFFLSDKTCYLFQRSALSQEEYDQFRRFISEKTGLSIKQRTTTGLSQLYLRVRDRVESLGMKIALFQPLVEKAQARRMEKDLAYQEKLKEKAAKEEEARQRQEELAKKEAAFHEELAANPEKMEEFKKSVRR